MQKKEFFGALLLVALVSSIMLAGFVSSTDGHQISLSPTSGMGDSQIDWIKGTGWTPNLPVTLYWDQQDFTHAIANVTADKYGKFKVEDVQVEGSYIGAHTIIAVQGLTTATALYNMKVTTTPDDRILAPIQQLEDKLDNTTSGLPGIQSNFTTVLNNVATIEGKLDNTTWGLPGIQSNFSQVTGMLWHMIDLHNPTGAAYYLENRTYDIKINSTTNFVVMAVYVNIFPGYVPPVLALNVAWNNVSFVSEWGISYPIDSTPYAGGNGTLEVLHKMKVEPPAGLPLGTVDICLTVTNAQLNTWDMYVDAVVEAPQDSVLGMSCLAR